MIEQPSDPNPTQQPDVINQPPPAEEKPVRPDMLPEQPRPDVAPEPPPTIPKPVVK